MTDNPIEEIVREFDSSFFDCERGFIRQKTTKYDGEQYYKHATVASIKDFIRTQFPAYAAKREKEIRAEYTTWTQKTDDTLDAIVRDYTSVSYIKVKSELRRRIEDYAAKEYERGSFDGMQASNKVNRVEITKEMLEAAQKGFTADEVKTWEIEWKTEAKLEGAREERERILILIEYEVDNHRYDFNSKTSIKAFKRNIRTKATLISE